MATLWRPPPVAGTTAKHPAALSGRHTRGVLVVRCRRRTPRTLAASPLGKRSARWVTQPVQVDIRHEFGGDSALGDGLRRGRHLRGCSCGSATRSPCRDQRDGGPSGHLCRRRRSDLVDPSSARLPRSRELGRRCCRRYRGLGGARRRCHTRIARSWAIIIAVVRWSIRTAKTAAAVRPSAGMEARSVGAGSGPLLGWLQLVANHSLNLLRISGLARP